MRRRTTSCRLPQLDPGAESFNSTSDLIQTASASGGVQAGRL